MLKLTSKIYRTQHTYLFPFVCVCYFLFFLLVLISVKTGLSLWPWANVMVALRVEEALHDILLVVRIVCACPTARGIGNLHQTTAVEEEPCHPRWAVCPQER